tara:strand:- start:607 stop:834 length:228 start_codon:yes stop_codon:yes gene_type:complete
VKVGDLVWYQSAGYNCGHHGEGDGPVLLIGFKERGINDKSSNTIEILRPRRGKVEEAWELQVGPIDEWEGINESG